LIPRLPAGLIPRGQSVQPSYIHLLEAGGTIGKRMDFLLQEMGRESNTIGSKGLSAEIAQHAITIKAEIEKLREQSMNIE